MLLDTHVWIWAAAGESRRIGPETRRALERARSNRDLFVSAMSVFEIAALSTAGRLALTLPAAQWIRESIDRSGLQIVEISTAASLEAGLIPASTLPDPADRFIVAAASEAGVPLVTRDERILEYTRATRTVRVIDAAR